MSIFTHNLCGLLQWTVSYFWSLRVGIQNRKCPFEAIEVLRPCTLNICEIESLDGSEVSARWVLAYQRNNKTDVFSITIFRGNGTMISELLTP